MAFGTPASYGLATFIGIFGAMAFFPLAPLSMVLIDKAKGTKDLSGKKKWLTWGIFGVAAWMPLVLATAFMIPGEDPVEVATEEVVESIQEVINPDPNDTAQRPVKPSKEKFTESVQEVVNPTLAESKQKPDQPYWEVISPDLAKYVPAICEDVSLNVGWTPSFYMNRQMDRVNDHVRALDLSPEDQRTLTYAGWGCITTTSRKDESAQEYGVRVYKLNTTNATNFQL